MRTTIFLAIIFFSHFFFSQNLIELEDSLCQRLKEMRAAKTEDEMLRINNIFTHEMESFLRKEGAFAHSFTQLKTIADLKSDDGLVRIIHWNLEFPDFSYTYAGFIARWDPDEETMQLTELKDVNSPYTPIPEQVIDAKNWYGALYYKIITVEFNGENEYVLLGWDGGTASSNFKIIDVLTFRGNNVRFGSPLFVNKSKTLKRVVFEYSDRSNMSLRMDEPRKRIVFDHLSPENPSLNEIRSFYVPDFSYDAYVWNEDRFELHEDVIAINDEKEPKSSEIYVLNPATGKPEKQKFSRKWLSPEDATHPGDIGHVPRTPESEKITTSEESSEEVIPKRRWWDRRNPDNLSVTTGKYKRNRRRPPQP